jgi:protein SERAC1
VRVLTYGYNANVAAFSDGASKDRVHNHGESLVAQLHANRSVCPYHLPREASPDSKVVPSTLENLLTVVVVKLRKAKERPIIFIAHSLGGLIVKRGLVFSENIQHVNTEHLRSIYVSTYAILFLATPHLGSDQAKMGSALQSITHAVFPKKAMDSSGQLLSALRTQSETLQNINRLFMDFQSRYRIYYFHESLPMSLGVTREFIVEEYSAAPTQDGVERMGIEADHSSICKFANEDSPGFEAVAEGIQRYTQEATDTVKRRWLEERTGRENHRKGMIESLGGESLITLSGVLQRHKISPSMS